MTTKSPSYQPTLKRKREERRAVPIHIALRGPTQTSLERLPPLYCGAENAKGVKVAQAAGNGTCRECVRLYKELQDTDRTHAPCARVLRQDEGGRGEAR